MENKQDKKELIKQMLSKGILISPDMLADLENSHDEISKKISGIKKNNILVLNKDIKLLELDL